MISGIKYLDIMKSIFNVESKLYSIINKVGQIILNILVHKPKMP